MRGILRMGLGSHVFPVRNNNPTKLLVWNETCCKNVGLET